MENVEHIQKFIASVDINALQSMTQAERLNYVLDSKDFMANIEAEMLSKSQKSPNTNSSKNVDASNAFLKEFSPEEKLEIQKKLSLYDKTLKVTLDAIKNGNVPNKEVLEPMFQELPSDFNMNQFLREIHPENIKKLKVNNDISVSLESDNKNTSTSPSSSSLSSSSPSSPPSSSNFKQQPNIKSADEYIEKMIKVINQDKNFDNFLEEVSKIEKFADNSNPNPKLSSSSSPSPSPSSSHQGNENVLNEEMIKKKINTQIIKALESFKLDDNDDDITNAITESIENNKNLFPSIDKEQFKLFAEKHKGMTFETITDRHKGLSIDAFTNQLQQFQKVYSKQIKEVNFNDFAQYMQPNNLPSDNHNKHHPPPQSQRKPNPSSTTSSSSHSHTGHGEQSIKQNKTPPKSERDLQYEQQRKLMIQQLKGNQTSEQRQQLQRECMEQLVRINDPHASEKSNKKKRKKKKKNSNIGIDPNSINHFGIKNAQNEAWLCDLCEYKLVYGEIPVFLSEWLQKKKVNQHDRMETYQRYLIEQRRERKRKELDNPPQIPNHRNHYDVDDELSDFYESDNAQHH